LDKILWQKIKTGDIILVNWAEIKRLVLAIYTYFPTVIVHDLAGYNDGTNDTEWEPAPEFEPILVERKDLIMYTHYPIKTSLYFNLMGNTGTSMEIYRKMFPKNYGNYEEWSQYA
jgi:hypothetical protein